METPLVDVVASVVLEEPMGVIAVGVARTEVAKAAAAVEALVIVAARGVEEATVAAGVAIGREIDVVTPPTATVPVTLASPSDVQTFTNEL